MNPLHFMSRKSLLFCSVSSIYVTLIFVTVLAGNSSFFLHVECVNFALSTWRKLNLDFIIVKILLLYIVMFNI